MRRLVFPRLMLLVVLTALSAGCTGSAESAGTTDVPTDGAQSSQSIQTPHERIVTFSGFDRDDVPNLSLHVLRVPSLGLVKRTDVDLDAIVELDQIGHSGFLRGRADNTPPSFFSVDSEYHIREVAETDIPDAAFGEPGSQPRVTLSDDKVKIAQNGVVHSIPLLFKNPEPDRTYWICNRGRSLIVKDGATALYLVRDVASPAKEKIEGLSDGLLAVDPDAAVFFVIPSSFVTYGGGSYASSNTTPQRNNPANLPGSHIVKVDAVSGLVSKEFTSANPDQSAQILAFVSGTILYSDYAGPLLLIDGTSGALRAVIRLRERGSTLRASFRYADRAYAVIGDEVVDVVAGKVVTRLPGFYPICEVAASPDGRYLVYNALADLATSSPTVVRCYDMRQRKVVAETTLSDIGSKWNEEDGGAGPKSFVGVRQLSFRTDGLVLAFAGTKVVYMDHMHTHEGGSAESPAPVLTEPEPVALLRGTLAVADKYATQVGIGYDTRKVFLVEDATIDGVKSPPVLLTATFKTSVVRSSDGSTHSYTSLAVGQSVEAQLRGLDLTVTPVDAIASRIEIR